MERRRRRLNTQPLGDHASRQPLRSHVRSNRNRSKRLTWASAPSAAIARF
jgi:hypothetical protein